MITATATNVQKNFGHYLQVAQNRKAIARLIFHESSVSFLTDSPTGILNHDHNNKAIRAEKIEAHESIG